MMTIAHQDRSTGILPVWTVGVPPAAPADAGETPAFPTGKMPVLQQY